MRAAILTLSDSGHAGAREDRSGPLIRALLEAAGYTVVHTALRPDCRREPLHQDLGPEQAAQPHPHQDLRQRRHRRPCPHRGRPAARRPGASGR